MSVFPIVSQSEANINSFLLHCIVTLGLQKSKHAKDFSNLIVKIENK